jgi:hypothetical protein
LHAVLVEYGGLDLDVSRHIAIRAFQADWLYIRQNNPRITAAIVCRFRAARTTSFSQRFRIAVVVI